VKPVRYRVMSFGLGGNTSEGFNAEGNRVSCHWYLRPEELQEYVTRKHYDPAEYEGCILIDKRRALEQPGGTALAFDSPMVDPRLEPGAVKRFAADALHPAAALVLSAVSEHSPAVGLLAARSITDETFTGLDHVSPEDYARWWKERGARLGTIKSGRVIWQDLDERAAA
jgi:hypothetical protein